MAERELGRQPPPNHLPAHHLRAEVRPKPEGSGGEAAALARVRSAVRASNALRREKNHAQTARLFHSIHDLEATAHRSNLQRKELDEAGARVVLHLAAILQRGRQFAHGRQITGCASRRSARRFLGRADLRAVAKSENFSAEHRLLA